MNENPHIFAEVSADLLRRGQTVRFRPQGYSMYPMIRDGDIIEVAPIQATSVKTGEVILYAVGSRVLAHRVLAIKGSEAEETIFRLQGDAHHVGDETVRADQILGHVVAVERGGRRISLIGRRPGVIERLGLWWLRGKRALQARWRTLTRKA